MDLPDLDALRDALSYGGVGVSITFGLIVLARILIRGEGGERRRLTRAPLLLLLGYGLLVIIRASMEDGTAYRTLGVAATLLLMVAAGRVLTVLVLDVLVGQRLGRSVPKIFRDIVEGLVYVAAGLLTLRSAGVDPGSLLTTSALLTAIIGLSLQDTLGNVFAGLALQTEHPFGVGDWIRFDDKPEHVGQVIEINWRATKVRTRDLVELTIPNGLISRASILNYSRPTPTTRRNVEVGVVRHHAPQDVQAAITRALEGCPEVLRHPRTTVVTHGFDESGGIRYRIRYFTENLARPDVVDGRVRDRIWYALRRKGFTLSVPLRDVAMTAQEAPAAVDHIPRAVALLRGIEFLQDLHDEELTALAQGSELLLFGRGENVVHQGDAGASLFVCVEGTLAVLHQDGHGHEAEIAQLSEGGLFGELSVMTGEPRAATVRSVTQAELLRLDHAAFRGVLEQNAALAEKLSARLVERKSELDASGPELHRTMGSRASAEDQRALLARIKSFFTL